MKRLMKRSAAVVLFAAAIGIGIAPVVYAAGLWTGMPLFGSASYCVGYAITPATATTGTGLPTPAACVSTAPAGPTTFTGNEALPADINGPTTPASAPATVPSTMYVSLLAMGNGPIAVNTTAGAQTIPNLTSLYVENVGNTSTTLTLPAAPIGGQIVKVMLGTTQTTSILFAASAGQSCLPVCPVTKSTVTAGTVFAWVYNAPNSTWYEVQ